MVGRPMTTREWGIEADTQLGPCRRPSSHPSSRAKAGDAKRRAGDAAHMPAQLLDDPETPVDPITPREGLL